MKNKLDNKKVAEYVVNQTPVSTDNYFMQLPKMRVEVDNDNEIWDELQQLALNEFGFYEPDELFDWLKENYNLIKK